MRGRAALFPSAQLMFGWDRLPLGSPADEKWIRCVSICADASEQGSGIPSLLREYGACVRVAPLKAGDYLVQDQTLVERKTAPDLLGSLYDRRLFEQLATGKKLCSELLLVIEGGPWAFDRIKPPALQGALLSVLLSWKIPILFTKDACGTTQLLLALGKRNLHQGIRRIVPVGRTKRSGGKFQNQLQILENLPQVGPHLARRLLERFETIENIIAASEEELQKVKGIGKYKAQRIRWVARESQTPYSISNGSRAYGNHPGSQSYRRQGRIIPQKESVT